MRKVNKHRLKAMSLKALGVAGAITLLTTLTVPSMASATSVAVAPGTSFTMTAPVQGSCSDAVWKQVTPVDATATISDGTLTLNWKNTTAITTGADVRFTAQLNTPVDGCSMSDKATLMVNGTKVSPYQNDLAAGGANLQMTWRAAAVGQSGGTDTPPPFNWDWKYPDPTCEGISIPFPSNLPSSQSGVMEVNVNGSGISGMNWKLEGDTYKAKYPNGHAGATVLIPWDDPLWRNASVPTSGSWSVTWIQVHGTNYHWQGEVKCGTKTPLKPEPESGEDTTSTPAVCLAAGGGSVLETTTSWTRNPVLNEATNSWEFGEKVYGTPVESTREATSEECPPVEKPEVPEPRVVYTEWVDGDLSCESTTVSQSRTATTTTYSVIPDGATWKIVEETGEPVVETQTRELTEDEAASCKEEPSPTYASFAAPTVTDLCGIENDTVVTTASDHGTWSVTKSDAPENKTRFTATFTPTGDYVVPEPTATDAYTIENGAAVWTLYASKDATCGEDPEPPIKEDPDPPVKEDPTPPKKDDTTPPKKDTTPVVNKPTNVPTTTKTPGATLAETGSEAVTLWVAAGAILLVGGAVVMASQARQRAKVRA